MLRIGSDIAERIEALLVHVVEIARAVPDEPALRHVPAQLVRASTSAGANYEEARGAQSRADFIHKVSVAAKEMREALFWIRFVRALRHDSDDSRTVDQAVQEATELAAILSASVRTARRNANQ